MEQTQVESIRCPEQFLLYDPTLPRPGPLQSDWVRRGVVRAGTAANGRQAYLEGAGVTAASNGRTASSPSSSPPKKLVRTRSAPGSVNLPKVSPKKGSPQAVGLCSPSNGGKSPSKPASALLRPPAGGAAGGGAGGGGAPSTPGKLTARSGTSAASTALPAGSASAAAASGSSSPASTSRAVIALKKVHARRGKEFDESALTPAPAKPAAAGDRGAEASPDSAKQSPVRVSRKVWVRLEGPEGEVDKVRVKCDLSVNELRKAVGAKTTVPLKDLQLKIGDKVLIQARAQAFGGASKEEVSLMTVSWFRGDRLRIVMDRHRLADQFCRGWLGRTLLHYCVMDGDTTLCSEVCNAEWGQKLVNAYDLMGDTALMWASICGYDDIVELLLDRQAEPDHINLSGRTALHLAAEQGHHRAEKALLTGNARRGPNQGFRRPDEVYLAELNDHDRVLSAIRVYELAEQVIADLGI